jgi:hypothetical protein
MAMMLIVAVGRDELESREQETMKMKRADASCWTIIG